MFDNHSVQSGHSLRPIPSLPGPAQAPHVEPLPAWFEKRFGDHIRAPHGQGTAVANVSIHATEDPQRSAAIAQFVQTVERMFRSGKLTADNVNLLGHIAADPSVGPQRLRVLSEALTHLGKPYNWGSTGPSQFDCSGLVGYCYKQSLGVTLPRTSFFQNRSGTSVPRDQLKAGDLVFFGASHVTHVALYLGDGMMLEAGGEGRVHTDAGSVRIRPLRGDYKGARRYIDDANPAAKPAPLTFGERLYRMVYDWRAPQAIVNWFSK